MRVTLDLPEDIIAEIQQIADRTKNGNRSAVIHKALKEYFKRLKGETTAHTLVRRKSFREWSRERKAPPSRSN